MTEQTEPETDLIEEDTFEATRLDPVDSTRPGVALTPFELRVYGRAGLSPREAQDWVRAGIEPYQAEAFRSAGVVNLADAQNWVRNGIGGVEYASWLSRGVGPDQILDARARDERAREEAAADRERQERENAIEAEDLRRALAEQLLVTVGEIAELADASSSSVVSHWRKGTKSFPAPVIGGRSPQFNANDVITWMRREGKLAKGRPSPEWYWCQAVRGLPADTPAEDRPHLRAFTAALVTLSAVLGGRAEPNRAPSPQFERLPDNLEVARQRARQICEDNPALRPILLHGLELATPSASGYLVLAQALRLCSIADARVDDWQLLDMALKILYGLSRSAPITEYGLTELMTGLLPVGFLGSVLDPACGEAELLAHLATQAQELYGIDTDVSALCVANSRFLLRPHRGSRDPGSVDIREGDALAGDPFAGKRFEAVVIDSPIGPDAPGPAEWVDLAIRRLTSDGRGVVLVPAAALSKGGPLAPVLRRGRIGAVILLPTGVRFGERRDLALCVVAGEDDRYERVLIVDISHEKFDTTSPQPDLSRSSGTSRPQRPSSRDLTEGVRRWLDRPDAMGHIGKAVPTSAVFVTDAARNGINELAPEAPLNLPDPEILEAAAALQRLLHAKADLADAVPLTKALERFLRKTSAPPPKS